MNIKEGAAVRGMHLPPMALVSLNSGDMLIAQAEVYERFVAELTHPGSRALFYRAAAALRVTAHLLADDPGRLAAYCQAIDGERAR